MTSNPEKVPDEAQSSTLFKTEVALEAQSTSSTWGIFSKSKPAPKPIAPIPQLSIERQRAAAHDHALNVGALLAEDQRKTQAKTVLYLAYGSNLSSKTFRNTRKIVPLAQINVCVPDLALTFDLPGIPYLEPCFAGTQYRDRNTGEPVYPHFAASDVSPWEKQSHKILNGENGNAKTSPINPTGANCWKKPLVGVVYEVTLADYARIIATEGGGASYVDVAIDCYPFEDNYDPSLPVPDHPSTTPFRAHTLLSPAQKNASAISNTNHRPHRIRHPSYSQPSPRYKSLLVTGAAEHNLPAAYRSYLSSVPAYRITSRRQRVGQILLCGFWLVPFLILMMIMRALADENGRAPKWLAKIQTVVVEGVWWSYDNIFRPIFGDGERTNVVTPML